MKEGKITVEYVDHMGSDLDVVNAARVSFNKESKWETKEEDSILSKDFNGTPFKDTVNYLSDKDAKLIHYLASHNHWSPFGHCIAKFRIKSPIFVARQLVKHQVGLCWNEVSRRYVDSEPEFYIPAQWRGKPVNKKQGSSDEIIETIPLADGMPTSINGMYRHHITNSVDFYNSLINEGIAPEQARMLLPQSMMTEWIWTGSLYAWSRIGNLRMKPDAQEETKEVAHQINKKMLGLFPVSWKELVPNWFHYGPSERNDVTTAIQVIDRSITLTANNTGSLNVSTRRIF